MTAPKRPDSWSRRISEKAHLPQLPNVFGLRAALLGYLGEVEQALRTKLGEDQQGFHDQLSQSGESTGLSDDQDLDTVLSGGSGDGDGDGSGTSTAFEGGLGGQGSTLRHRASQASSLSTGTESDCSPADAPSKLGGSSSNSGSIGRTRENDPNLSLLQHLTSVREDVRAYLPNRLSLPSVPALPSMPQLPALPPSLSQIQLQLNREWLRSLPGKLSVVDMGVTPSSRATAVPSSGLNPDGKRKGKGKLRDISLDDEAEDDYSGEAARGRHGSSVESARKKVIDLVHALLPSEEWAGWEKLGWEEQDREDDGAEAMGMRRPVPLRSRSASASATLARARSRDQAISSRKTPKGDARKGQAEEGNEGDEEEDEDETSSESDEPEYLFPNLTPASAHAHAVVRNSRHRSISLSAGTLHAARQGLSADSGTGTVDQSDSYFRFKQNDTSPIAKAGILRSAQLSRRSTGLGLGVPAHSGDQQGDDPSDGASKANIEDEAEMDLDLGEANALMEGIIGGEKGSIDTPDMGPTLAEALHRSEDGTKLIRFTDLPFWWRNNEHVVTG